MQTREKRVDASNGWLAVGTFIITGLILAAWMYLSVASALKYETTALVVWSIIGVFVILIWLFCMNGFFMLQPNEAAVLMLFGAYKGTATRSGLCYTNPFFQKKKISLRARNLNAQPIKVNDLRGNPIEIAAVVVWRVRDTAQAVFDVDQYEKYVSVQVEAALRHLAMAYPYDSYEGDILSLRGSTDEISGALKNEIEERVSKAGVVTDETRLSHLAYAPEIAGAMLQRQQAEAVVAARTRIVDGAVGMVELALARLEKDKIVELDPERRAVMVSNLMVVLCGHEPARPIINTGTLYT